MGNPPLPHRVLPCQTSLASVLVLVAALLTLVCRFIPAISATLLLLLGMVVAALLGGFQDSDLPIMLSFTVLTVLAILVDNLASAWSTLVGLLSGVAAKLVLHLRRATYALWHFWNV